MAQAPAAPSDVKLDASGLTHDSTLVWAVSADPHVVGYRVVWRDTGATTWQHAHDVGRVGTVTLPVSKDNEVFGGQALSARGHASLAACPLPLMQ